MSKTSSVGRNGIGIVMWGKTTWIGWLADLFRTNTSPRLVSCSSSTALRASAQSHHHPLCTSPFPARCHPKPQQRPRAPTRHAGSSRPSQTRGSSTCVSPASSHRPRLIPTGGGGAGQGCELQPGRVRACQSDELGGRAEPRGEEVCPLPLFPAGELTAFG